MKELIILFSFFSVFFLFPTLFPRIFSSSASSIKHKFIDKRKAWNFVASICKTEVLNYLTIPNIHEQKPTPERERSLLFLGIVILKLFRFQSYSRFRFNALSICLFAYLISVSYLIDVLIDLILSNIMKKVISNNI